ncbi:MAG TPA: hypothetical protein VNM48_05950 [Chloroflexota bacterium]|nr:hypothetical protein [Chloroflexota bacterium]
MTTTVGVPEASRAPSVSPPETAAVSAAQAGTADPDPLQPVSLLWPSGRVHSPGPQRVEAATLADLDVREAIRILSGSDPNRDAFVTAILAELGDAELILYRQDVLEAILEDEQLRRGLSEIGTLIADVVQLRSGQGRATWSVTVIARRLMELEGYVRIATQLRDELARASGWLGRSRALRLLHAHLAALTGTAAFRALQEELPVLRATLDKVRSVTIGINLTRDLSPDSATILSISAERVEGRNPLLDRLFGRGSAEKALSPLHDVDLGNPGNVLNRDLQKLLGAVVNPVANALGRHTHVNAQSLDHLEREIHFLLRAVALTRRLEQAGLPTCRPEIAPESERVTLLTDAYNVGLALRSPEAPEEHGIITNTVTFDGTLGRVWILTGPNRGGKTTYTRAVGQAHILFQAGLRVCARRARLSPITSIYSHFPTPESEQLGMGKLDEEAQRLAEIFRVALPSSLILLNEVLAGTSAIEALGLAIDAVRALRLLGTRAIYTTHLHELPARAEEINASTPGDSRVGSLVAGAELDADADTNGHAGQAGQAGHRRTFRIQPGPPQHVSYASEIAEQHGISFAQLQRLFEKRGVLAPGPVP